MTAIKERIIDKLKHLETISEPVLQEVLEFVSYLEWRLATNRQQNFSDTTVTEDLLAVEEQEDTGVFLLGLATSFSSGLSNKDLASLPLDGAEHHDRYLYNRST